MQILHDSNQKTAYNNVYEVHCQQKLAAPHTQDPSVPRCCRQLYQNSEENYMMNLTSRFLLLTLFVTMISCNNSVGKKKTSLNQESTELTESIKTENVTFVSEGVQLAGTIYIPNHPHSAVVIVHGSDQVPRMTKFAELLAENDILVLTYDKRGVGESGGVYAGPEVGTNNISVENLNLLAKDASSAVNVVHNKTKDVPIGLIGASQAGWIIPIVANNNPLVKFMVLLSCPTITTLEQLRFQFYTNGRTDFWDNHTEEEAREQYPSEQVRLAYMVKTH